MRLHVSLYEYILNILQDPDDEDDEDDEPKKKNAKLTTAAKYKNQANKNKKK